MEREVLMPSRSVVTRENLSLDFEILPSNPSGPLRLRLSASHFLRDPETGEISVIGSGGGIYTLVEAGNAGIDVDTVEGGYSVGVVVSAAEGNQISIAEDGLFVPAPEDVVIPETAVSGDPGNQIALRVDGVYAGASDFDTLVAVIETDYAILPQEAPNIMLILASDVLEVQIPSDPTYLVGAEYTLVKTSAFTVSVPTGVSLNDVFGPATFDVGALPDGVVVKNIGEDQWVAMGNCALVE